MNSQFLLDEDHRPRPAQRPAYSARHYRPEGDTGQLTRVPTSDPDLAGEGPTRILPAVQSLPMPLEPRPEGAVAVLSHRPKRNLFAGLLAWLPFGRPTR